MKLFKYLILFTLLLSQSACDKDWLKPEPLSFFSPENVFVDKAGMEALLITMRKDLKNESTGTMPNLTMEFAASDLASPWSQLDFYNLTPNTDQYYRFLTMFTVIYSSIKNCNVLISRIDDIKWASDQERNAILGEALWHRAYWYYRLVNSYGDVPFLSGEIQEAKLDFQTHSRWTILEKIRTDVEFAAEWLPATAKPGVITKGAANHLLTKIYLANLEFDKAIEAATKVINGPYALMTQRFGIDAAKGNRNLMWDLHRPKNFSITQNTETILAAIDRYEAPPAARSVGLYTMRLYNCQWFQPQVLDSQGKPGMVASGPMYDSLGRGNANIRLTGYYQYDIWSYKGATWRNTPDLRRADINWVDIHELKYNNPASVDFGKPINTKFLAAQVDTFKHVYAMPHYIMYNPQDDPKAVPMGGNGDWYIFRLAETYLLRAEAYLWKNQLGLAADDINKVRQRAKAMPVSAGEVTVDFLLHERARELFAEEPRHSELVRISYIMAKAGLNGYSLTNFSEKNFYFDRVMKYNNTYEKKIQLLGNTANMAPFHALWPIPSLVITANTKGVINQNIGYDGANRNVPPLTKIE
ncbi:RagB/SusD family nutrient uptake outer membrane protein [Dyadobacter fermentans]|uniref:RagB/SusD domain protein n=1 Tax=Dyadobacter fermentans (strain ATCC 700827 / DSM 18053 / CIP 107007 / KCTC 52180 / NS114) TaxID=471854 RepID=C6W727_DYAFD|nr:RagB/SusD family nutrient uptake outer membrane protein [Dyadobacter fermentans]ACT92636.1 RagB/SusD domain protein [Dyadobacter fermentans DSM 18053]